MHRRCIFLLCSVLWHFIFDWRVNFNELPMSPDCITSAYCWTLLKVSMVTTDSSLSCFSWICVRECQMVISAFPFSHIHLSYTCTTIHGYWTYSLRLPSVFGKFKRLITCADLCLMTVRMLWRSLHATGENRLESGRLIENPGGISIS